MVPIYLHHYVLFSASVKWPPQCRYKENITLHYAWWLMICEHVSHHQKVILCTLHSQDAHTHTHTHAHSLYNLYWLAELSVQLRWEIRVCRSFWMLSQVVVGVSEARSTDPHFDVGGIWRYSYPIPGDPFSLFLSSMLLYEHIRGSIWSQHDRQHNRNDMSVCITYLHTNRLYCSC